MGGDAGGDGGGEGMHLVQPPLDHALGQALDQLGEREIEILRQFAGGATTEEIAAHLNLSVKTVQNYHYLIKTKTGARTDAQLVRLAATCGLTRI